MSVDNLLAYIKCFRNQARETKLIIQARGARLADECNITGRKGTATLEAFHGLAGIDRIVADLMATSQADPRIGGIFRGQDIARLRCMLKNQFCVLLNDGCAYPGRDIATVPKDLGI